MGANYPLGGCICRRCLNRYQPTAPYNHFAASSLPCENGGTGCDGEIDRSPTICERIVSAAGIQTRARTTTPHDHFAARPDCRVKRTRARRVDVLLAPTICERVVHSARIQVVAIAAPPQTIISRPVQTACVTLCVGESICSWESRCPSGIVFAAGVRTATPNDHFVAGPNRSVPAPAAGSSSGVGGSPGIIRAGRGWSRCVDWSGNIRLSACLETSRKSPSSTFGRADVREWRLQAKRNDCKREGLIRSQEKAARCKWRPPARKRRHRLLAVPSSKRKD